MSHDRPMTRTDAMREAERLTGRLQQCERGWYFTFHDFRANASRESQPCRVEVARKLRSVTVAVTAHRLLCGDDVDAVAAQDIAHRTPGGVETRLYAILRALPAPARKMMEA